MSLKRPSEVCLKDCLNALPEALLNARMSARPAKILGKKNAA